MPRATLRKLLAAALLTLVCAPAAAGASLYSQTIYRWSAFSTQSNEWLCTAAVAQHITNLAVGQSRHSSNHQLELYQYGRAHNLYPYKSRGVDPQGMEATLEKYVAGSDWQVVKTRSLQAVLQAAARQMRATGLPVVLFVAGGKHVWTMNGYVSTADPASGRAFKVTKVRFSGPYYPRQTARLGWFDIRPNSVRSSERLAEAFFPYREKLAFGDRRATPWNGYFVAVVPITRNKPPDPEDPPDPDPSPSPSPTADPTPGVTPGATNSPSP